MYRSKEAIDDVGSSVEAPFVPISSHVSRSTDEVPRAASCDEDVQRSALGSLIVIPQAGTPPPRFDAEPGGGASPKCPDRSVSSIPFGSAFAVRNRNFEYHRRARRKLHPLQETRSVIDVWPAPRPTETKHTSMVGEFANGNLQTTTASVPQLLTDIIGEVKRKLQNLCNSFPQFSLLCDNSVPTLADFELVTDGKGERSSGDARRSPTKATRGSRRGIRSPPRTLALLGDPAAAGGTSDVLVDSVNVMQVGLPSIAGGPVAGKRKPPHHLSAVTQQMPQNSPLFARTIDGVAGPVGKPSATPQQGTLNKGKQKNDAAAAGCHRSVDVRADNRSHVEPKKAPIPAAQSSNAPQRRKSELGTMKRTAEDIFRQQRLAIFEGAGRDFAKHFPTYRLLLEWVFREFRAYESYCHQHVVSPEMRLRFEEDLRQEMLDDFADERARLTFELSQTKQQLEDITSKYQQLKYLSQTSERRIAEKDALISQKDAEIAENNAGRVALLSRLQRLEKDLWAQRDAMEGPEAIISGLRKEVKSLDERLTYANKAVEESNMDKAVLKVRLERLEDLLKERKLRQAQTVPKSELLIYKKAQIDILELNAQLEAKLLKIRSAYRSTNEELQRVKSGLAPGTPRPPWHLADDIFPAATTTAQRVHLAMREYRAMTQSNQLLSKEVDDLKKIVAMIPRGDNNEGCEYVLYEMQLKYFYKLGFESSVPMFLRGNGKATNLKLSLEETAGYCRQFFLHRDAVRPSTTVAELIFESFASKYAPSSVTAQDFAYSVFYAMRWYAFDPFIGLMRKFLLSQVDCTVLAHLEKLIFGCKLFIQSAADENHLGTSPPAASSSSGDAVVEAKPTEHIRRKSVRHLINAAEAEAAAEKQLDPNGGIGSGTTSFGVQAITAEEPRLLYKAEILPLIADFFCGKNEEQLKLMVSKISLDYPGVQVDSRALFRFVGAKRRFTLFVEEVIRQAIVESEELATEYVLAIQSVVSTEGHVVPQDVAKAIWKMDPLAPAAYMDDFLADVFEVSIEELRPGLVEGSFFKTPGADGERCYEENSEDPLMAEERQVVDRLRRRVLRRFCPRSEAETETLRMQKEAERAKERAEFDY